MWCEQRYHSRQFTTRQENRQLRVATRVPGIQEQKTAHAHATFCKKFLSNNFGNFHSARFQALSILPVTFAAQRMRLRTMARLVATPVSFAKLHIAPQPSARSRAFGRAPLTSPRPAPVFLSSRRGPTKGACRFAESRRPRKHLKLCLAGASWCLDDASASRPPDGAPSPRQHYLHGPSCALSRSLPDRRRHPRPSLQRGSSPPSSASERRRRRCRAMRVLHRRRAPQAIEAIRAPPGRARGVRVGLAVAPGLSGLPPDEPVLNPGS